MLTVSPNDMIPHHPEWRPERRERRSEHCGEHVAYRKTSEINNKTINFTPTI